MSDDDTWIDIVLNNHGDYCKNCNTWRELQNGLYLEQCPNCDDDEINIYEADFNEGQLARSETKDCPRCGVRLLRWAKSCPWLCPRCGWKELAERRRHQ